MRSLAYWISPGGIYLRVQTSHIAAVLTDPEKFRCTRDQLLEVYQKNGEPVGLEGRDREEIIRDLILPPGWIRARRYFTKHDERWSFTVEQFDARCRALVISFLTQMEKTGLEPDSDLPVHIKQLCDSTTLFFNSATRFRLYISIPRSTII